MSPYVLVGAHAILNTTPSPALDFKRRVKIESLELPQKPENSFCKPRNIFIGNQS